MLHVSFNHLISLGHESKSFSIFFVLVKKKEFVLRKREGARGRQRAKESTRVCCFTRQRSALAGTRARPELGARNSSLPRGGRGLLLAREESSRRLQAGVGRA